MSRLLLLLMLSMLTLPAQSKEPFRQTSIVLLQSGPVLQRRVQIKDLSDYIKRLNAEAGRVAEGLTDRTPRVGSIAFAVRPDGTRKVWLDLKPALSAEDGALLRTSLEAAPPCAVKEGTVVGAVNVSLWGGKSKEVSMPMPEEWRAAITGDGMEITKLVDSIWPAVPAAEKQEHRNHREEIQ